MSYNPEGRNAKSRKGRRAKDNAAIRRVTATQIRLTSITNKNLFSDHFLFEILPGMEEWKEDKKIVEVFAKIKSLYAEQKGLLERYNESQLEKHFIQPIFDFLNHHFEVQEAASSRRQPDYAFFPDDETRREAHLNKGEKDFYNTAVAVGDAKSWDKPLDKPTGKGPAFEDINPSFQIDTYLRETAPRWAILTNGRFWRIYFEETSYKLSSYFEVDLVDIINKDDLEWFKYFYFFFRLEAFLPDEKGKNFLEKVYRGSIDYARELGESLQENVYSALKILAEGFLTLDENKLEKKPETIEEIHSNALVFLYRVLFVLYAESRGLLDTSNETYYRTFSFSSIKREIAENIDGGKELHSWHKHYWDRIKNLFSLINAGSESKSIPKKDLFVPPYNGSLFNPSQHEFLERYAVGDSHLAKVIDLLTRSNGGFIDYSTLDIRHLGSIYEGLLEFKLKIAEEDMVSIQEKGKEIWVSRVKAGKKVVAETVEKGGLYLVTDKGERKATGSYYTPGYIVKYIVKNTLGPAFAHKIKEARENGGKESEAILSIKIIDPAMGSGHFLVEAVDFLVSPLLEALRNDTEKGLIPEAEYSTEWAKREVVSHCIYGVDKNPLAVELAKLSLWLATIAKDKPLSFLDHRLKCGNSLIGTSLENLHQHPKKDRPDRIQKRIDISGFVKKLVDTIQKLSGISDDTLDNIKQKEKIFSEFKETLAYNMMKTLADVRTSIYFDNDVDEKTYGTYSADAFFSSSEGEWRMKQSKMSYRVFVQKAEIMAREKRFFHWELEFPEAFFEAGKKMENPGFDVVIGNPPYGAELSEIEKSYLDNKFLNFINSKDAKNSAIYFVYLGLGIKHKRACFGFIIPKSFNYSNGWTSCRNSIFENLNTLIDTSKAFENVLLEQTIFTISPLKIDYYITGLVENGEIVESGKIQKDICKKNNLLIAGINKNELEILEKILNNPNMISLGQIVEIDRGLNWQSLSQKIPGETGVYRGAQLSRYYIDNFTDTIDLSNKKIKHDQYKYQLRPKILNQLAIAHVLKPYPHFYPQAFLDYENKLVFETISCTFVKNDKYRLEYLLSLNNSKVFAWLLYKFVYSTAIRSTRYDDIYLYKMPIPRINFTTTKKEREHLLSELITYYDKNNQQLIDKIEKLIPKGSGGNTNIENEKSDVIHDFLAFLAWKMIELNKQKHAEVKGFLEWLEGEIGASIKNLSNNTLIKEYYESKFEKLIEVLKNNKKHIPIDPSRRDFQEKLKSEFDKSMTKLIPLKEKIQVTDGIIDQIVSRLYGLTDEEVEIINS